MTDKPTYDELILKVKKLERDSSRHKKIKNKLKESEKNYRSLVNHSLQGILIIQGFKILFANPAFSRITGYSHKDILSLTSDQVKAMVYPDDQERVWNRFRDRLNGKPVSPDFVHRTVRKDRHICWIETYATRILYMGEPAVLATFIDITNRKCAEELAEKHANNLMETNAALKVLLKNREEDKIEFEENMLLNINQLIFPYIGKLKKGPLNKKQENYLDIVESNLKKIISPFARNLSSPTFNLTPTEMQVANMIQQGKSSKEISEILTVSKRTIDAHRRNIRKKFGMIGQHSNLRSFLQSIQ